MYIPGKQIYIKNIALIHDYINGKYWSKSSLICDSASNVVKDMVLPTPLGMVIFSSLLNLVKPIP